MGFVALCLDGRHFTNWATSPAHFYSYPPAEEDKTDTEVINNLFKAIQSENDKVLTKILLIKLIKSHHYKILRSLTIRTGKTKVTGVNL